MQLTTLALKALGLRHRLTGKPAGRSCESLKQLSCCYGHRGLPVFAMSTAAQAAATSSSAGTMRTLENLNFDNAQMRNLPVDSSFDNSPRPVPGACFSLVDPTPVQNPQLVAASEEALALLDIGPDQVGS